MDMPKGGVQFELVKRDGRREEFSRAKLARSLMRAGVGPKMIERTLGRVEPRPGQSTDYLRARVVFELALSHPSAARRYATTRSLIACGSEQAGFGWVCMNLETMNQLGLRPGDGVWLSDNGTPAPFSIENHKDVGSGQAWLNPREMVAMEVRDGTKLAASGVYHGTSPLPEEPPAQSLVGATPRRRLERQAADAALETTEAGHAQGRGR